MLLPIKQCEIIFTNEPEYIPIEGNCMDSGDKDYDKKCEQEIINDLVYNEYAWFCAKVVVSFSGIESEAEYLRCCSYKDKNDFINNSGYYDDMVSTAHSNLESKLTNLYDTLSKL